MYKMLLLCLMALVCRCGPDQCATWYTANLSCLVCKNNYSIYTVTINYCCHESCTACDLTDADNCTACPQDNYLHQKAGGEVHCELCDFPNLPPKCVDCSTATSCSDCEPEYQLISSFGSKNLCCPLQCDSCDNNA